VDCWIPGRKWGAEGAGWGFMGGPGRVGGMGFRVKWRGAKIKLAAGGASGVEPPELYGYSAVQFVQPL